MERAALALGVRGRWVGEVLTAGVGCERALGVRARCAGEGVGRERPLGWMGLLTIGCTSREVIFLKKGLRRKDLGYTKGEVVLLL